MKIRQYLKKRFFFLFIVFISIIAIIAIVIKADSRSNLDEIYSQRLEDELEITNDGWRPLAVKVLPNGDLLLSLNGSQLFNFSALKNWNFTYVCIAGMGATNLDFLNSSSKLKALDILYGENLTDISALQNTKIEILVLDAKKLTNISAITGLPLKKLSLTSDLLQDISPIQSLLQLKDLSLRGNNISDISFLSGLPLLEHFILSSDSITNLSAISSLKSLTHLILYTNSVRDFRFVNELKRITWLEIKSNNLKDLFQLEPIIKNSSLRLLSFSNSKNLENIVVLHNLNDIDSLYLNGTSVSDLTPLVGKRIRILDIRDTPASQLPLPAGIHAERIWK